jgi:copper resistance protein B
MKLVTALAATLLTCSWPGVSSAQTVHAAATHQEPAGRHGHEQHSETQDAQAPPTDPHASHRDAAPRTTLPPNVPELTDADRRAAFPDVKGHAVHDNAVHYFVQFDQIEWRGGEAVSGLGWESTGWIGRDLTRFWFRTQGEGQQGHLTAGSVHALYGRAIAPWWDLVVGVRQDVRPGSPQTWAAVGIQGLAPYWFEIEATAYVGASARTRFRFEAQHDVLVTNRLILQPRFDMDVYGKSDAARGVGAGLSSAGLGLRVRYELRREVAPYVGVVWRRAFFGTAEHARVQGTAVSATRVAVGLRLWL